MKTHLPKRSLSLSLRGVQRPFCPHSKVQPPVPRWLSGFAVFLLLFPQVALGAEALESEEVLPVQVSQRIQHPRQRLPREVSVEGELTSEDLASLYREAMDYQERGLRRLAAVTWGRIAEKLDAQGKPQLAIVFYKRALNLLESVRADLRGVARLGRRLGLEPPQFEETLVDTFSEDVYRPLVNLLLQQRRAWEAQQVLDLMIIQELDEYFQNVEVPPQASSGQSTSGQFTSEQSPSRQPQDVLRQDLEQMILGQLDAGPGQINSGQINSGQVSSGQVNSGQSTGLEQSGSGQLEPGQLEPAQLEPAQLEPAQPVEIAAATSRSSTAPIENWQAEERILAESDNLQQQAIQSGQELEQLRQIPPAQRTPDQEARIAELVETEQALTQQFNSFLQNDGVVAQLNELSVTTQQENLNPADLNSLRDNLRQLDGAVLLYPLILDDRLELILTTADAPPLRYTVNVRRSQLENAIAQFRQVLTQPDQNPQPLAQQLYRWLIEPLAADLAAAGAKTIIYAPDGQLRYIPLAALHDGHQWLVERYRINYITSRSLTDLNTRPAPQPSLLAAAFVEGDYDFQVGQRSVTFSGLPFAGLEVQALASIIQGTTLLEDASFSPQNLVPRMDDYKIVHLATHAALVSGAPENSFIVFGSGDRVTLRDIETWSLPNVDLVVLSACETALGGSLGNGTEILGLGYQIQRTGARAAIASLWQVDDGGTQQLMEAFYDNLKTPGMTKVAALQQAQIALVRGKENGGGQPGGDPFRGEVGAEVAGAIPGQHLSHPYYWAPFVLIGNGL